MAVGGDAAHGDGMAQNPDSPLPGWAGAGGALAPDAPAGPEPTGDPASGEDRIAAIVTATRAEVGDADIERISDVLARRFAEEGLDVDADRTVALAAEIQAR
jgi:hypothetical protein